MQVVFAVGLLQLVQTVSMHRIWKFHCSLISNYIDDEKLVNFRASNIVGNLRCGGFLHHHPQCDNLRLSMQLWDLCICLLDKSWDSKVCAFGRKIE